MFCDCKVLDPESLMIKQRLINKRQYFEKKKNQLKTFLVEMDPCMRISIKVENDNFCSEHFCQLTDTIAQFYFN